MVASLARGKWDDRFRARFRSLAQSKLRLCSANHREGYFSNLACDWLSIVWAYSEQETENGPSTGEATLKTIHNSCESNKLIPNNTWVTVNNDLLLLTGEVVCQSFENHATSDQKIVIHGN